MADANKRRRLQPQIEDNNNQPSGPRRWVSILFYVIAFALIGYYLFGDKETNSASKELSYTKLTAYVEVLHLCRSP